jgi:hypothetical protein
VEPEEDHGDSAAVGEGRDLTEIAVERQQDTCVAGSLLKKLAVRQAMQVLITEMECVVSMAREEPHQRREAGRSQRIAIANAASGATAAASRAMGGPALAATRQSWGRRECGLTST